MSHKSLSRRRAAKRKKEYRRREKIRENIQRIEAAAKLGALFVCVYGNGRLGDVMRYEEPFMIRDMTELRFTIAKNSHFYVMVKDLDNVVLYDAEKHKCQTS